MSRQTAAMKPRKTISNPLQRGKGPAASSNHRRSGVVQLLITLTGVAFCIGLLWQVLEHGHDTQDLQQLHADLQQQESSSNKMTTSTVVSGSNTFTTVQEVRNEFYRRYGGKEVSEAILSKGVHAFGSVTATAHRILQSASRKQPFVLSFAGYSVTVGRGNHYQQSFPFVLERILRPLLQHTLDVPILVRNAAIGGIPSFPYGFCFEHFLGNDAQVISWDFSMNEGRGAAVLESYIRQSQHQLPQRPMVILLDTNLERCQLLQRYTELGLLADGMCVGMAKDVVDDPKMLDWPDEKKAPGFQHWQEFGAPKRCPGRGNWHPKKMEHELLGWMIAMHFVQAVEEAQGIMDRDANWKTIFSKQDASLPSFPKPLSKTPANSDAVTDLLFGHASADGETYKMKELSCRTNFLPATDKDKVLPSIVVSGLSPGISADNIMEERSDDAYRAGWVLDVSKIERDTKIKVDQCGGLGYVDLKTALYGVPESGTLRLWLPVEGPSHDDHEHTEIDTDANHWFDELILCEANEKRPPDACHLDQDLEYTVGGATVESPTMIKGAAEYLKRHTCVHVGIPVNAQITRLEDVQSATDNSVLPTAQRQQFGFPEDHVGLIVDLRAKSNVSRKNGACCLSHIVWEQH